MAVSVNTFIAILDDDDNTNQVFTLHFKHDHGPVADKTVTETIHYVGTPTALSDHQASLTFVANDGNYRDLVDSKLDHISGWHLDGKTTETGSFASVANPQVDGYHVVSAVTSDAQNALDDNQVKGFDGIKSDSNNIEVTVTYAKNEPVAPTEPVPELPNEPATSSQAVQPTNSVQVTKEQVSQPAATVSPVLSKSTTKALPQTGNEQKAGLIGLGFASLLGALGLGALMKRHDSEKKF